MKTALTEILEIEYPIIQGGMAWVAEANLAAAVSNAGGLGIIGAGGADAKWVENQIIKAKTLTDKPFGVNIMLMNPQADEIAKVVAKHNVKCHRQCCKSNRSEESLQFSSRISYES